LQLAVKLKSEPRPDGVVADPRNPLQQSLLCSAQQHQQSVSTPHPQHVNPSSSSSSSATTGGGGSDVTWRHGDVTEQQQQQQLRAIQQQLLLMHALPAMIPANISQSGSHTRFLPSTHRSHHHPSSPHCLGLKLFFSANPSHRSLPFYFRTDSTDSPDCLPILLSLSIFLLFSFSPLFGF